MCSLHHRWFEIDMMSGVILQLAEQAQMQMSPLAHRLWLIVTLLPAMQSVLGRRFALLFARLSPVDRVLRRQPPLESIQHCWNVVDELRAGNCRGRHQLRIVIDGAAPGRKNRLTPLRQKLASSLSA